MKYALVLHSEFHHPNYWVCYALANSVEKLEQNLSYDPSVQLMLHKEQYKASPISELELPSSVSGSYTHFIVCEVDAPKGLEHRFEL